MRNCLGLVAIALGIAGCGQMIVIDPDPNSRHYMPPVGTVVRVNENLMVPPGWARVFLQRGEAVSYSHMDLYHPSCNFELYTVDERPHFASRWLAADSGMHSGGPSMIMRTVRMKLESKDQPGMYMMTCRGGLDNPPDAREISINEMRMALGDKATILLPEEH